MKIVRIQKLENTMGIDHPNNINEGFTHSGMLIKEPTVGEVFWVGIDWRTSRVTEIIDENTFRTLNSVYFYSIEDDN